MLLVSDEREFKGLLSRLEEIALNFGNSNSLDVYRGGIGPIPMKGLPVQDKGYSGLLFKNPDSTQDGYVISVDLGRGQKVLCDVAPADPRYITFRRDNKLVAVIEHRPFLDDLYVNKQLEQAREKGERIIDIPEGDVVVIDGALIQQETCLEKALSKYTVKEKDNIKVILPVLYIVDGASFQQQNALNEALRNEFGYGLDIKYKADFQFPQTVETPPIALDHDPKKFNEKWESGKGWEKLKIPAVVYEVPIKGTKK